jgi:hypothetical protein
VTKSSNILIDKITNNLKNLIGQCIIVRILRKNLSYLCFEACESKGDGNYWHYSRQCLTYVVIIFLCSRLITKVKKIVELS